MASSERKLPTSTLSRPKPLPTPQPKPPAPTSTATPLSAALTSSPPAAGAPGAGVRWARTVQPSCRPTQAPAPPPSQSRLLKEVPRSTWTPKRSDVFSNSVCNSPMPTCRRSGSAPKSSGGGSRQRAPKAFSSSPHQCQRWSRFSRVKPFRRSTTVTWAPKRRNSIAARRPLGPAPTTTACRPAGRVSDLAHGAVAYSARAHRVSSFFQSSFAFQWPPSKTRMAS
mmetsp:Transcript_26977/g.58766  ORF Transcript_26977/g.58766 Transcript_26977/m.58766 type:complete len:225 (-) Transcript_26977:11-685(-)